MRKASLMSWMGAAALGIVLLLAGPAGAAPTTQFSVTGDVAAPAIYDLTALRSLPPTTETVTYRTGSGPKTANFTGPTAWTLLNTVRLSSPPAKNGLLRQYAVATGSDGYSALFSLGELDPNFGGTDSAGARGL
jgi:hypothetical protein